MAQGLPAQLTVTGKIGPGNTITTQVFTNVTNIDIDTINNMLRVVVTDRPPMFIDVSQATTYTWTVASNKYTLSIS